MNYRKCKTISSLYRNSFIVLFLGLFSINTVCLSQPNDTTKTKNYPFIGTSYHHGIVLMTNSFVRGENRTGEKVSRYQAFDLKFGKQTDGSKLWEQIYNFPYYGIGIYHANFYNDGELGSPISLYGFWGSPLKRYRRGALNFGLSLGLGWNWEPFDEITNPWNVAIGSKNTAYIDIGTCYNHWLSNHFELIGGLTFTHFSNGAMKKPNKGINLFAPTFEMRYHFSDEKPQFRQKEIPDSGEPQNEIFFFLAAGSKQRSLNIDGEENYESSYQDLYYDAFTISAVFQRQYSYTFKAGLGIDISYDESTGAKIEEVNGKYVKVPDDDLQKISLGIVSNFEKVINRISLLGGIGVYVARKKIEDQTPVIYMRAGMKYHFWKDFFLGVNVRAHNFSVADYTEWNIGHTFKLKKKR